MYLYLSQHGEAESETVNPDRPLTVKGKRDVERIAVFTARGNMCRPAVIYHSGKTRAMETAELFGRAFNPPQGIASAENMSPKDDPAFWGGKTAGQSGDTMLVGHLPHLGRLASLLLCGDPGRNIVEFRNGCILCLEKKEMGLWSIQWLLLPSLVP